MSDLEGLFDLPDAADTPPDSPWPFVAAVGMVCATVLAVVWRVTR